MPDEPVHSPPDAPHDQIGHTGRSRRKYNIAMKWIRQIHMCLGLFLFPWVLLYGITGFLLNHPTSFPDHEIRDIGADELVDTAFGNLPAPEELSQRVFTALVNRQDRLADYAIVDPERARYRHQANVQAFHGGKQHNVNVNLNKQSGKVHIRQPPPGRQTPLGPVNSLDFDGAPRKQIEQGAVDVLNAMDIPVKGANPRWGPLLEFEITDGQKTWIVGYNLGNRNINARPQEGRPGLSSFRQYLLRLHFAHTFPAEMGTRTFWAIMVDLMAIFLILWACTGFMMWWQRRNFRLTGAIIIGVSVLWASGLGYLMYQVFRS